jgi:hypothetical protein
MAARIAQHFGETDRPAQLQSEISRETGQRSRISAEARARRERNPGRVQERQGILQVMNAMRKKNLAV